MAKRLELLCGALLSPILATSANAQAALCNPSWQPTFGAGPGYVHALLGHDDGSGPALFVAGPFPVLPGTENIGRWNGTTWTWLGNFTTGSCWYDGFGWHCGMGVGALAEFDPGSGLALYVAGNFYMHVGSTWAGFIAKWDGVQWSDLQGGLSGGYPEYYGWGGPYYETQVHALTVFDDGSGPVLYVGGDFTQAGAVTTNFVARWNGSAWSALGLGMNQRVFALTTHDDGSGPALYAGGEFTGAGGVAALGVAKWNGSSWSALGSGLGFGYYGGVLCLASFDGGSGPALYAGGGFSLGGAPGALHVAKWDGTAWSAIGTWSGQYDYVYRLITFDDGTGPALYAAGTFTPASGPPTHLIRWNGTAWSALGSDFTGPVWALTTYDLGGGPSLFAGGNFTCPDSGDTYLACWAPPSGCSVICEPGTGSIVACPCSNPPGGPGRGCDNSTSAGGAMLAASGTASLASDTVALTTSGELPTALSIVLQGDALQPSGAIFGQGVRCVAGSLKRLYVKTAVGGSIGAPGAGDPSISARSAALGDVIPAGFRRLYGVYYRDPSVLGGCPATSTFNLTQQLGIVWQP